MSCVIHKQGRFGRLRLALIGALAIVVAGVVNTAPADAAADRQVSVLTFNIYSAISGGGTDLEGIAREITASGAEVALLQEVDKFYGARSGWKDQPSELARLTGMQVAFGAATDLAPLTVGAPRRQSGNAVLSKRPIVGSLNTKLPNAAGAQPRSILRATVMLGTVRTDFYATHLHYQNDALRTQQARAVVSTLAGRSCARVLGGDLNSLPHENPTRIIAGAYADTWAEVGMGAGQTQPAQRPSRRVDYVFHDKWATALEAVVRQPAVSDHRGVLVRLRVSGSAVGAC